jgi:16S rRNA (guanine527-N7)-methyltransferase
VKAQEWQRLLAQAPEAAAHASELAVYLELLERWGQVCDLTGPMAAEALVRDHLRESLVAAPLLLAGTVLDVGSGNGFPGIPLLVARRDVAGVLLEPRVRRWAFLKEAVRVLGVRAEVLRVPLSALGGVRAENLAVRGVAREVWENEAGRVVLEGGRLFWWAGPRAAVRPPVGFEDVVTCPLPNPERGRLVVWGRCST